MAFLPLIGPLFAGAGGAAAAGAGAAAAGSGLSFGSVLGAIGTGVSAVGTLAAGAQANAASKAEAKQLEMKAAESRAVAQREAMEEERQNRLLQSNAIAQAAAGGGSTEDPGILDMLLDMNDVGVQNARMARYQGEVSARNSMFAADMRRAAGRQAMVGGMLGAGGTLFSGLADTFGRDRDPYRTYAQKYGTPAAGGFG